MSLVLCFVLGPMADKFKLYKMMIILYSFVVIGGGLFLADIYLNYQKKIGLMFWIGLVMVQCIYL